MNARKFLIGVGLSVLAAGCNRYSYPPSNVTTASSVNQDIIASHSAPKTAGEAHLEVASVACQGSDYVVKVRYDQGFEDIQFLDLQYQVLPKSSNVNLLFTQPTGTLEIKPPAESGDITLIIPGDKIPGKDSDVLLRLKLKTRLIVEYLSAQEQLHISDICR